MAQIISLELLDGSVVDIELGFNAYKCMVIAKDFPAVNKVFAMAVGEDGEEINMMNISQSVYVAYRQANMKLRKPLTFEQWCDPDKGWEFEANTASSIYLSMLNKEYANQYAEELEEVSKKAKKGKSKSK